MSEHGYYKSKVHPGWIFLGGLLVGGIGIKCLCSKNAKDVYVKGAVLGIKAKNSVDTCIDKAKAEYDDIMAEAEYIVACEEAEKEEQADKELGEAAESDKDDKAQDADTSK